MDRLERKKWKERDLVAARNEFLKSFHPLVDPISPFLFTNQY